VKAFGEPGTINRVGTKDIDYYPATNMKVTYVNGKVTDVKLPN
jgi:hypothetical protein